MATSNESLDDVNTAEKIAATYLRLNGFLLLPHFTVFDGNEHNHIDLIALRAAHSAERVGELKLPVDELFFSLVSKHLDVDAFTVSFAIIAEVRTNKDRDIPSPAHIQYAMNFLGSVPSMPVSFAKDQTGLKPDPSGLRIGNAYAMQWILQRIKWMDSQKMHLTKTGSWAWSEDFLSDILVLRDLKLK
jgi:hypothetical protein